MAKSLQELYQAWQSGKADEAGRAELMRLLVLPENEELALQLIRQAVETDDLSSAGEPSLGAERLDMILQSIIAVDTIPETIKPPYSGIIRLLRHRPMRYAAAAVVLFALATVLYMATENKEKRLSEASPATISTIGPGGDRAILTLSDGSTIILDSTAKGNLAKQGDVLITKNATGIIVYDDQNVTDDAVMINTITTPRGGQFQLVLQDGTRVWLNAASSLRYPTSFTGDKRVVEVTGEAYFEVKKDAGKPFFVRINNQAEVQVTGTSFNINGYTDEPGINTTLVEGSVRVAQEPGSLEQPGNNGKQVTLVPGQQARIKHAGDPDKAGTAGIEIRKANIEKVTAWKNGVFDFEGSTLKDAMRQLARWYDLEIVYDDAVLKKGLQNAVLVGGIRKELKLADVLEVLNVLGLHFRMEQGRKLVLLP